jgi:hypothetical protein
MGSSPEDSVYERKKSSNEIDFFCEKQVQASKEDFLINMEFNNKPTKSSSPKNKS